MTTLVKIFQDNPRTFLADSYVVDASVSFGLSQSGEFSFQIPRGNRASQFIEDGVWIELWSDGEKLIQGNIQTIDRSFNDTLMISVSGRDAFDGLYSIGPYAFALWEGVNALQILDELLRFAGWRLGNIKTFPDPDIKLTIDLREEDRLLTQIQRVLDSSQKALYRYGGISPEGYPLLDVGLFGEYSRIAIISPPNDTAVLTQTKGVGFMTSFDMTSEISEITHAASSSGGNVTAPNGVKRSVYLGDALGSASDRDNAITDPEFGYLDIIPGVKGVLWNRSFGDNLGISRVGTAQKGDPETSLPIGNISTTTTATHRGIQCFFFPPNGVLTHVSVPMSLRPGTPPASMTVELWEVAGASLTVPPTLINLLHSTVYPESSIMENRIHTFLMGNTPVEYGKMYMLWFTAPQTTLANRFWRIIAHNVDPHPNMFSFLLATAGTNNVIVPPTTSPATAAIDYWITPEPRSFPAGLWSNDKLPDIGLPDDGVPITANNLKACGEGLWNTSKGVLLEHETKTLTYSLGGVVGEQIHPTVGDSIRVIGHAQASITNPFTGQASAASLRVDEILRVDSVDIELSEGKRTYNFEVSTLSRRPNEPQEIILLDKATKGKPKQQDQPWRQRYSFSTSFETFVIENALPTAIDEEGVPVLDIIIPTPLSPTTGVLPFLLGTPYGETEAGENLTITVLSSNMWELPGARIRIKIGSRDWRYSDVAEVTYLVGWR